MRCGYFISNQLVHAMLTLSLLATADLTNVPHDASCEYDIISNRRRNHHRIILNFNVLCVSDEATNIAGRGGDLIYYKHVRWHELMCKNLGYAGRDLMVTATKSLEPRWGFCEIARFK